MDNEGRLKNLVVDTLDNHRAHRSYLNKEVPQKILERILMSAIRSPSSMNGQHLSYIVVKDSEKRRKIASVCGSNPHIAQAPVFILFTIDYFRIHQACQNQGVSLVAHESFEGFMVGCVDVGIALSSAIITAESLGLAICPIGGVRINPEEISKIFNLPKYTFGAVGLTIGYAEDENLPIKPRFPYNVLVHQDHYQERDYSDDLKNYDEVMLEYGKQAPYDPHRPPISWSQRMAKVYKEIPNPKVKAGLQKQGFNVDK